MEKSNRTGNIAILLNDNTSLLPEEVRLLFGYGMDAAKVNEMITSAKRNYVLSHHPRKIFNMPPNNSWKNGCWKTYVRVDSKRKEITASTEEKLIEKLYVFYKAEEDKGKTLEEVFEKFMEYKKICLNRSEKTISTDRNRFSHIPKKLLATNINEISDEDIQKMIVSELLPNNPKPAALKRTIQLLRAVFDYGIRKKICIDNPVRYILAQDYYKFCDLIVKTDEQKAFSSEELDRLSADAEKHLDNPRVLMALFAKETGMRVGELTALHTDDVGEEYVHVHRQQVSIPCEQGNKLEEVPYTKDERLHPHNGRYIPLTKEARRVVELAKAIPGKSVYLFHDKNSSKMIPKDGFVTNLRRRCNRLGCIPTNNHAFRMAFNSRLIELGFSSSDRALILGHEVQTNETHYSLTDKRRLDSIKTRLNK